MIFTEPEADDFLKNESVVENTFFRNVNKYLNNFTAIQIKPYIM